MSTDINCTLSYQTNLFTQIFSSNSEVTEPGIYIYKNNLYMTATRSLSLSYPVISKMLGEQAVYTLARRLIAFELPETGDWADWGKGLASILEKSELHEEHPYLSHMANLEWAFLLASRSKTATLDTESLMLLENENVEDVMIKLQKSLMLIASDFPLLNLWRLHRHGNASQLPNKDEIQNAMDSSESGYYLVCQSKKGTSVVEINKDHFYWVKEIQSGKNIGELLDKFPDFQFSTWVADSITNGWIVGLRY